MGMSKREQKPNQLGWITSLSYGMNQDLLDVSTYGNPGQYIGGTRSYTADISIAVHDPGALMELFQDWMHSGISQPTYQKEFMCLYCGSPNKIEHTHCSKCGAPRSFVIG
jgi:hypothetical protein